MVQEGYFRDIDVALMMHGSPTTTCDVKSMANYSLDVTFYGKVLMQLLIRTRDEVLLMRCF